MKISELNTKSFLGGAGAAANSYVLINYEDNSTSEPVTYKASLQELGKAIANDLKLPSVTVSEGAITNFKVKGVSNGAYTETVVEAPQNDNGGMSVFESAMIPAETIGDPSISTYVVTTDEHKFYVSNGSDTTPVFITYGQPVIVYDSTSDGPFGYYESDSSEINHISVPSMGDVSDAIDTAISGLASTGDVTDAVNGLASTGYVDDAISGLASTGYVNTAINDLASTNYVINTIDDYATNQNLASTGYVDYAVNGLASTGYVTNAIANAGGGLDPVESISCAFIPYGAGESEPLEGKLYPLMADGDAIYKSVGGVINPIIPWNNILFYNIYGSQGEPRTLFLKDKDNTTLYSIQLN